MSIADTILETIETYRKHGWQLRRLLLTDESRVRLGKAVEAEIRPFSLNAAWFSRPPGNGPVAWELRNLGSAPFALVIHADETDAAFEDELAAAQERLAERARQNA